MTRVGEKLQYYTLISGQCSYNNHTVHITSKSYSFMQKNIAHSTIVRVLDRLKQHVQVKKKFGDLKTSTPLVDATVRIAYSVCAWKSIILYRNISATHARISPVNHFGKSS